MDWLRSLELEDEWSKNEQDGGEKGKSVLQSKRGMYNQTRLMFDQGGEAP